MTVKVTMFMGAGSYSWSESHYLLGASTFQAAIQPAAQLATFRFGLLGDNAFIIGVRLSAVPANRQVFDLQPSNWPAEIVLGGNPSTEDQFEPPFTSLMLNLENANANKNLYLAGVPDNIVSTQPGHIGSYYPTVAFGTALTVYMFFLLGQNSQGTQWGFRSRQKMPAQAVIDVGTQAGYGNNMGLTTAADPGIPVGSEAYTLGFKTKNPRIPNISGAYKVVGVIAPGSGQPFWITVLGQTGNVDPNNFLTFGFLEPLQFQYLQYQSYHFVRITHRKRGGSYGLPRGRSRARR
jgi:hypothetical protein